MRFSKKELTEVLDNYDLGNLISSKEISTKTNLIYKIRTSSGNYIIKVFGKDSMSKIKYRLKILRKIRSKNVPVPDTLETKDKKLVSKYNKPIYIIHNIY